MSRIGRISITYFCNQNTTKKKASSRQWARHPQRPEGHAVHPTPGAPTGKAAARLPSPGPWPQRKHGFREARSGDLLRPHCGRLVGGGQGCCARPAVRTPSAKRHRAPTSAAVDRPVPPTATGPAPARTRCLCRGRGSSTSPQLLSLPASPGTGHAPPPPPHPAECGLPSRLCAGSSSRLSHHPSGHAPRDPRSMRRFRGPSPRPHPLLSRLRLHPTPCPRPGPRVMAQRGPAPEPPAVPRLQHLC